MCRSSPMNDRQCQSSFLFICDIYNFLVETFLISFLNYSLISLLCFFLFQLPAAALSYANGQSKRALEMCTYSYMHMKPLPLLAFCQVVVMQVDQTACTSLRMHHTPHGLFSLSTSCVPYATFFDRQVENASHIQYSTLLRYISY